ncbi:MAG TPA: transcriptional repressor [Deltaproteobacteria bacterium]|nr:transcriptional repressor [Deltaproteobacteria bacterium]
MDPSTKTLRDAGLRATAGRRTVLTTIASRGAPLTHAEIASELTGLDPVTLYRILDSLERAGLVHRVHGLDGVWRYCPQPERRGCPGNHVHFLCTTCGAMSCLVDQPLPRVTPPPGGRIDARQFVVGGTCARCSGAGVGDAG